MSDLPRLIVGALAAVVLVACQKSTPAPEQSIGVGNPHPVSTYECDGMRLDVRLMGESASVSVTGAAAVELPKVGEAGTTFSNGSQTLLIEQGRLSWSSGTGAPVACTGG
jgi:hypothetical protein